MVAVVMMVVSTLHSFGGITEQGQIWREATKVECKVIDFTQQQTAGQCVNFSRRTSSKRRRRRTGTLQAYTHECLSRSNCNCQKEEQGLTANDISRQFLWRVLRDNQFIFTRSWCLCRSMVGWLIGWWRWWSVGSVRRERSECE